MAENDTLIQSAFPTQPIWVPPGGYKIGQEMVVFAASRSVGKSFFSEPQPIENLTSF